MPESSQNNICTRIAQVRLEVAGPRGKSSFAKQLRLSPSTYDYYEANRVPPAEVLVRIAAIAGIDIRWLLTGESSAGPAVATSENLPIIQRAAELLSRHPEAAKPLTAFLDILAETMKFPAAEVAADDRQEHLSRDSARRSGAVAGNEATATILGTSHEKHMACKPAPKGQAMPPSASQLPGDLQLSDAKDSQSPGDSQSPDVQPSAAGSQSPPPDPASRWIPILGRSAAGVSAFWAVGDDATGLTTLAELIDRYANTSQADLAVRPACRVDSPAADEPVHIISLRQPADDEQGPTEFVAAEAIKSKYPDAFAVRIDGESMSPEILHGDLVILSPGKPAVAGRAAVVQIAGAIGVTCKLYHPAGDNVHLVPINETFSPAAVAADQIEWALQVLARIRQKTYGKETHLGGMKESVIVSDSHDL